MFRSLRHSLALLPFLATAAVANAPVVGMVVGDNPTDVSKSFEALGYRVLYVGIDGDLIEADLRDSNGTYDVFVDPTTGLVTIVEIDHDYDGDA
jgi:hypothetical protein